MRRPNFSHIFTRGITAIKKSLALATKGLLDQKIGGKQYIKVVLFTEELFEIKGIKSIEFELIYDVIGRKITNFSHDLFLNAVKLSTIENKYLLNAILKRQLLEIDTLVGQRQFKLRDKIILNGLKNITISNELDINGAKRFDFNIDKNIVAKRRYSFIDTKELFGLKTIDKENIILVKGKRDIANILVALDLFGGGKYGNGDN